jgi:hypothetical protein
MGVAASLITNTVKPCPTLDVSAAALRAPPDRTNAKKLNCVPKSNIVAGWTPEAKQPAVECPSNKEKTRRKNQGQFVPLHLAAFDF